MKRTLFLLFILIQISAFGQKLEKSKSELNSKSGSRSSTSTTSTSRSSSNDDDYNLVAEIFINITWGVFKYGFIGDYSRENHLYNTLSPYPYFDGESGNYANSDSISMSRNRMRFDIEDNFVYSSNNLYGNHFKAKIRPFQYFYVQTDFHQLFEIDKVTNTDSRLSLFQFNLNYDRIRFEKFNFGWNLGATYIGNDVKKTGLAYGLNAEYFMGKNISFSGSAKWSNINSLPVNAYEIRSKFHKKNYFFSLGFEHLKIATPTYNFIALGGGIYF